jgi:Aminotransferase class I and II
VHDLRPYVPGEQPRASNLIKLNTNESPLGPSPRALEAIRAAAADTLRLYPDPQATALRRALASYHRVQPEQVFVGNGSDEVLAHVFVGLLKQQAPLLFPDITYGFYPTYCKLFSIEADSVPLNVCFCIRSRGLRHAPTAEDHTRARLELPTGRLAGCGSGRRRAACGRPALPKSPLRQRSGHRPVSKRDRTVARRAGGAFFQSDQSCSTPGPAARTRLFTAPRTAIWGEGCD